VVADPRFFARAGRVDDAHCALTLAERDRRWKALRAAMDKAGLDCLFVWGKGRGTGGNCRWIDNADASERCLVFPRKGNPVTMWAMGSWTRWYWEASWEGVEYLGNEGKDSIAAARIISDYGYAAGTIGLVGLAGGGLGAEGTMPYFTFRNLQRLLPKAQFRDAGGILTRLRMFKSAEELLFIEKASEIANLEIDVALRNARPGVRESELYSLMECAGFAAGADPMRDYYTILSSGKGYPTNRRQTDRLMRTGDLVQIGVYARYGGYWSHPHVAISLGALDSEYRPLREAVRASTQAMLDALRPGTPWRDVERAADEPILRRGYYHEITHIHALGLDGTEPPVGVMSAGKLPETLGRRPPVPGSIGDNDEWAGFVATRGAREEVTVQPGLVLALEAKATIEDRLFVEFGPQVVVEAAGPRILTPDAMDVIEL
jgi:Xaa-Pro aminopeptidase